MGQWLSSINGSGVQKNDDWYKIVVKPGTVKVKIECTFTHADGDIHISLYDSLANWIEKSEGIDDNELIQTTGLAPGEYFIVVYYGNAGNEYDLKWEGIKNSGIFFPIKGKDGKVTIIYLE